MSNQFDNISYDLSWLFNPSNLPSPKLFERHPPNPIESLDYMNNVNLVSRNLNRSWDSSSHNNLRSQYFPDSCSTSNNTDLNMKESSVGFLGLKEPGFLNIENDIPSSHIWRNVNATSPNNSKLSQMRFSSNSPIENTYPSDDSSLNAFNYNPFNFELMRQELLDAKSLKKQSNSFSGGFHEETLSERLNFPITPLASVSPSTSSSPPRLNQDLINLMQELALITNEDRSIHQTTTTLSPFQSPPLTPSTSPVKGCVFCKNNCYHSTFYKSHVLKDINGYCICPVLRTYICPLCGGTGDFAHTLKYCPRNTVTKGDPIAAGLPPGKVTNWREVATRMSLQRKRSP